MAVGTSVINVAILGDSKNFQRSLTGAQTQLKKFSSAAKLAFAGAAIAGGKMAIDIGGDIETMRNNIIAGTGASGDALDGLIDSARSVATDVPDSFDDVSRALADVSTNFGTTGKQLEEQTQLFLDFARVAGTDVSQAITIADSALTVFGENNADEALGDLLRVAQQTGRPLDELLGSVEQFGPVFANMGFSLEETTALMGGLEQAGIDVTRISPGLNKFARDIAAAGGEPRKALEETVAAIQAATSDTEALNLATQAFGAEGAQRLSAAIRSGNFDLENFGNLLGDGTGLVAEQADGMLTLSDRFAVLTNRVKVGLMPAIEAVLVVIEDLVVAFSEEGLAGVVTVLREKLAPIEDWMKRNKPIMAAVAVVIGGVMVYAVYSLITAFLALLSPFVLIVAALAAVVAAVVYAYENFETFRNIVDTVVSVVVAVIQTLYNSVKTNIDLIVGIFRFLKDDVGSVLSDIIDAIGGLISFVMDLPNKFREAITGIFNALYDVGRAIVNGIIAGIKAAPGAVMSALESLIPGGSIIGGAIGGITGLMSNIPGLAEGGIVTGPTLALIGEAGPEAVVPLDRAGGIGGGMNVTVNMPPGSDGADVVAALQRYARAHGGTVPILTGQL
jgi:phage-related minor tail protein